MPITGFGGGTFFVDLSNPANGTIADGTGRATIRIITLTIGSFDVDPDGARVSAGERVEEEAADAEDGRTVVFRPGLTMEEMERRAIAAALAEVGGNRRKAAELLGIGERTLYRKIKQYEESDR